MFLLTTILLGSISAILLFLYIIHQKQSRRKKGLLFDQFNRLATQLDLRFSSQEVSRNTIIGIDGLQRKVLYIKSDLNKTFHSALVNLEDVKQCSLWRNYGADLEANSKDRFIKEVALEFQFKDNRNPVRIPFYDFVINSIYELTELDQKARHWELMLSKLLRMDHKVRVQGP